MQRHLIWNITVHFYPRAVEAGVQPVETSMFGCDRCELAKDKVNPDAFYHTHTFAFDHPASREQFIKIIEFIPWTANFWGNTLIPLLKSKKNEWPVITSGNKASSTDIVDEQGRKVGRLEVRHEHVWMNQPYHAAFVTVDERGHATCRLGRRRQEARDYLDLHVNRIRERTVELAAEHKGLAEQYLRQAVRECLIEGGFIQTRNRSKTKKAAVAGAA